MFLLVVAAIAAISHARREVRLPPINKPMTVAELKASILREFEEPRAEYQADHDEVSSTPDNEPPHEVLFTNVIGGDEVEADARVAIVSVPRSELDYAMLHPAGSHLHGYASTEDIERAGHMLVR